MARFAAAASLVLLCLAASICTGEASATTSRRLLQATSITQLTSTTSQFSTLNAAINAAGLSGVLSNSSLAYTVFAPTNDAFNGLFKQLNTTAPAVLAQPNLLSTILRYHVVPTPLKLASFTNNQVLNTLLGQILEVGLEGPGTVLIEGYASEGILIPPTDVSAGMSIVQPINTVLIPNLS